MSRLKRFYPKLLARHKLNRILSTIEDDKESAVNIIDKETDGDIGGQQTITFPEEFPAGETQHETHTGPEFSQFRMPRQAELGQELTQLTTERETGKSRQKLTEPGRWDESYSDDNQFEDADLKLGENKEGDDEDSLEQPVYEPYAQGVGPLNPRYEDAGREKYNIILHAAKEEKDSEDSHQLWVCVDMDGTILSAPDEYQDSSGNQLFGEPLPGAKEALQELIDGGARVSIYTARQYFEDDEAELTSQIENEFDNLGIPYSDVYIGKKPPAHFFVDDRTIPPFDGDWDLVLDAVRDKLKKKARRIIIARAQGGEKRTYEVEGHPDVIKRLDLLLEAMNKMGEWGCSRGIVMSIDGDGPEFLYVEGTQHELDKDSFEAELNGEDVHIYKLKSIDEIEKKARGASFTAEDLIRVYELEYKLHILSQRDYLEDKANVTKLQWEDELRVLLGRAIPFMEFIFEEWVEYHDPYGEVDEDQVRKVTEKSIKDVSYEKGSEDYEAIYGEMFNFVYDTAYDKIIDEVEPYKSIYKMKVELEEGASGDIVQDRILMNRALGTAHNNGPMMSHLSDYGGIDREMLAKLTAGDYTDQWEEEAKRVANDPVKDTVDYQGIKIDIEWPSGSIRSYEGDDTYVTHMKSDYGYARGIEGNDGEELDIYLVDRDSDSNVAFIIEQLNDEGDYDEDKIVLGVHSEGEAADCFLQHMPSYMLGDIREVPVDRLVNALYGEPEDRRGEEDLIPSEEKEKLSKSAGLLYMANKASGEKVGLFIPLPPELAKQYPDEGKAGEDDSDPHLTVLFVGDVPTERTDEFIDIVEQVLLGVGSFELTLGPVSEFTNHKDQRIIHSSIQTTAGDIDLSEIHNRVRSSLTDAGFDIKHAGRDFKSHITIEYVNPGEEPKFADVEPTGSWTVDAIEVWGLGDPHIIGLGKKKALIQKIAAYSDAAIEAIDKINITPLAQLILQYIDPQVSYVEMVDELTRAMLKDKSLKDQIYSHLGRRPELEYPEFEPEETTEEEIEQTVGPSGTQRIVRSMIKRAAISDIAIEVLSIAENDPRMKIFIDRYVDFEADYVAQVDELTNSMLRSNWLKETLRNLLGPGYKATKIWPGNSDDEEEWTDPVETRENRDIPRNPELEKIKYGNI